MLFRRIRPGRFALPAAMGIVLAIGGLLVGAACANNADNGNSVGFDAGFEAAFGDAGDEPGIDCGNARIQCGSSCVQSLFGGVPSDPSNCGKCGNACASGMVCVAGSCAMQCPLPLPDLCNGVCTDEQFDPNNCGQCGVVCPQWFGCFGGTCRCALGQVLCGGDSCVDVSSDPNNCGTCGNKCAGGFVCRAGTCASCGDAGLSLCPGLQQGSPSYCVDTTSSPTDCGMCGAACDGGDLCVQGKCGCGPLLTACAGACVNTSHDPMNCGGCAQTCDGGSCVNGKCQP